MDSGHPEGAAAVVFWTGGAAKHIQERHIADCAKADPAYSAGAAAALAKLA